MKRIFDTMSGFRVHSKIGCTGGKTYREQECCRNPPHLLNTVRINAPLHFDGARAICVRSRGDFDTHSHSATRIPLYHFPQPVKRIVTETSDINASSPVTPGLWEATQSISTRNNRCCGARSRMVMFGLDHSERQSITASE
jgi:hypothetical protein